MYQNTSPLDWIEFTSFSAIISSFSFPSIVIVNDIHTYIHTNTYLGYICKYLQGLVLSLSPAGGGQVAPGAGGQ